MEVRQTTFTQQELADRWGVTKQTIKNMENAGQLKRLLGIPGVRYRAREVYALEGMEEKDWDPMTPFERRKLLHEIEEKDREIERLKAALYQITQYTSEFMRDEAEKKAAAVR